MSISSLRSAAILICLSAAQIHAQQFDLSIPIRAVAQDGGAPVPLTWVATEGGIFRSVPTGPEWINVYVRPAGQVQPIVRFIHVAADNPQTIYLISNLDSGGIWKSIDGGRIWTQSNKGLPTTGTIDALITQPAAPSTFYARLGDQLYLTTDGAANWKAQGAPLPRNTSAFDFRPADPSQLFAASANGIYRSRDGGANWVLSQVLNLASSVSISSILIDRSDPTVIHLVTRGPSGAGAGFYRSINGGERFDAVVLPADRPLVLPARLVTDAKGSAVYAGSDENGVIYYTTSKGQIWGQFIIQGAGATTVTPDATDPRTVLAGTGSGVYVTNNGGARWVSKTGPARPTLSVPEQPLEFVLPAGSQGRLQFLLRAIETTQWTLPLSAKAQGGAWLSLDGDAVNTPATPFVAVDARNLTPGEYTAEVHVEAPAAPNAPIDIPVKLRVVPGRPVSRSYQIATIAGNGQRGNFGDGQLATRASFSNLDSLAVDRDGNIFVSDPDSHVVRRIAVDGTITRYAGNGRRGDAGDAGQALLAQLDTPSGVALDAAGNLYISETGNGKIRRVDREGTITTFANIQAPCRGIAVDSKGNLFVTVPVAHSIVRVTPSGQISLYSGVPGLSGFRGDGGPVGTALLSGPTDVFVDSADRLLIADSGNHRIRRVDNGVITTVAGSGSYGFQGDGPDATKLALSTPSSVAADPAGNIYIGDAENHRIRLLTPNGTIQTIAGTGSRGFSGDNGPALIAAISGPQDVLFDRVSGTLLSAEQGNLRIRRLTPPPAPARPVVSGGPWNWADNSKRLAPGTLFRLRGTELSTETAAQADAPWATELALTRVLLNGAPMPLAYVSPNEITGVIPFDAPVGTMPLQVVREGAPGAEIAVTLTPTAPALLLAGPGRALSLNEDGSLNSADHPAPAESLLKLYFTGSGLTEDPPRGGAGAGGESKPLLSVLVLFGEVYREPVEVRLTPGRVGIAEAVFRLPVNAPGDYQVAIRVGEDQSAPASVVVGSAGSE